MKNTQFQSTIAEITDIPSGNFKHPFLTRIKFIFADNQGNNNHQGIEAEDFPQISQSAINMPIKLLYTRVGAGGHDMSIPIGHIVDMSTETIGTNIEQLVGGAVLYSEEYPDEVKYLKDAFADGKAPGISWELAYSDVVERNGIEWLKNVITRAATFVRHPAYGSRTSLLAIAQNNILSITESQLSDTEFMDELNDIVEELNALVQKNTTPDPEDDTEDTGPTMMQMGGMKMNEEELAKAQADLATALDAITDLETKLSEANTLVTTLTEENNSYKRATLVAERTAKIVEAGIKVEADQEKLAQKQEIWLTMSQEIFETYVADLAAASKATTPTTSASASQKEGLPKFTAVAGTETTLDDLKSVGRRASRGDLADL